MDLHYLLPAILLSAGLLAGLGAAVLGLGAGLILVPALLALLPRLGIPASDLPAVALASSLSVSLFTSAVATHAHWRCGNLDRPFSATNLALMASAAVGAMFGAAALPRLPAVVALLALASFQLAMGAHLLRTVPRPRTQNITSGQVTAAADLTGLRVRAYFALVGCLASVGMAGSFIVPFLVAMRLPQRSAVALASWLGIAIAGVASTVYAANAQAHPLHTAAFPGLLGVVHVPAVALLAIGSYAAARAGARFATHVRPAHLQRAIGGALILSGLYTILVRL